MKLKHSQTLRALTSLAPTDETDSARVCQLLSPISCLAISPDRSKLAACISQSNHVVLYDLVTNQQKDKFALKASNKTTSSTSSSSTSNSSSSSRRTTSNNSFAVTGMCFSPDSDKIAVGQSDCVIFVYKIGQQWGEKKSIVNKFSLPSPVASLHWLSSSSGLVYASIDGRIKFIQTQSNKMFSLMTTNSICVSLAVHADQVVAGFYSGLILLNSVQLRESGSRQIASHSCPPIALVLTSTGFICAAGNDGCILFQEVTTTSSSEVGSSAHSSAISSRSAKLSTGSNLASKQTIELGEDISLATTSPSGTVVILGSRDNLVLFELESRIWRQKLTINLGDALLVTSMAWSNDGTKLVASTINGAIELFRCQWKVRLIGNRFEVNYVGSRQVVINDLHSAESHSAMFNSSHDIGEVKIIKERFVVIWTSSTLVMGSLTSERQQSEIEWLGLTTRGIKFSFDYENVVLISAIGELFLVELGQNCILGSVRTDFISPHLLSVRINERKSNCKVLAYLLDAKTIAVLDLITNLQLCTWSHGERIDWVELNETGNKLIYRDKALKLVLLNIINQEFVVLLNLCQFVQWVPGSDVVVAQSKDKLYVWYDFNKPVIHSIGGGGESNEAIEIERANGSTRVIFAVANTDVLLDEVLLEFDTAINDGDLERAESFLESLQTSNRGKQQNSLAATSDDTSAMWLLLGNIALKSLNLSIGERAFAAIGDIAKVTFIKQCVRDGNMTPLLDNDWDRFEAGDFDTVLSTYLATYNWDKTIGFARRYGRLDLVQQIETQYYSWLLDTGQHSIAAQILEKAGKIEEAISLYMKSGRMLQVTKLVLNSAEQSRNDSGHSFINAELVRKIIAELMRAESFEEAGDLYQLPLIDDHKLALQCYVSGKSFAKAINLARKQFPDEVVALENQYGDYLLNQCNDPANAVNHFIEAGKTERALEAAIQAKQFDRASEIASILDNVPPHQGKKIADYYAAKDDVESALEMYLTAGCIRDAVQLLNQKGQYARAYKIAKKLMEPSEASEMYEFIAKQFENDGKYREAEKIYVACGDVDSAISMYKNSRQFEAMVRLVKQYHPDLLNETCLYLAKQLEADRLYKQAEMYYISGAEWKLAVLMYRNSSAWEDAYRVARSNGGAVAAKQVAFHWAQTMTSPVEAVSLLNRYGLLNQVVDYALDSNDYEFALGLILNAGNELKHKLIDVRLKYALWLENEGHYHEAESMFIAASKPKEAVVMYLHANNFDDALRVAENCVEDQEVAKDVLTAQARHLFDRAQIGPHPDIGAMNKMESLLLRAGRIEIAIRLYKDAGKWNEAVRVCEQHAPHLIDSLRREMIAEAREQGGDFHTGTGHHHRNSAAAVSMLMGAGSEASVHSSPVPSAPDQSVDLHQELKVAEQNDDKESIVRYTILLASQLLKDRLALDSLKVLHKHDSVFILPDSKKLLSRIAIILLSELEEFSWADEDRTQAYSDLRDCLHQLLSINSSSLSSVERDMFEKYLLIAHLLALKTILETILADNKASATTSASELHLKTVVSLLRYSDVIRVDKAFYEAGIAARSGHRLEMAFVFLNHFLDLLDAIEEHDYNVDHSDFVGTDIPYEVPLPQKAYYDQAVVEDTKGWILQTSMDTEISQSLPLDPLREGEVYEASLLNSDSSRCLPCLVTGYPVIRHKMIEFVAGKYAANKEDWNKLLMLAKITENQQLRQVLHFVGRLCGNSTLVKFSFQ